MQDIHDIRPPVMAGTDPALVKLLLIAAAVLLGIALAVLLVRILKKRGKPGPVPEVIPTIAPLDRAMADLDRLAEKRELDPGLDPRAFYFKLARIVKRYMGEVFGANCLEMTTPELIRTVKGLDLPQGLKRETALFQELSDPFRYAPVAPSSEQLQADLDRARSLVAQMAKETSPAAPEEKK